MRYVLGILAISVITACATTQPPAQTALTPCSVAQADFARIMNPAFTKDFANCTVTTTVAFSSPDWGVMVGGDVDGYAKWSATPPGVTTASTGPLGLSNASYLQVKKDKADIIFKAKKGDLLTIQGHVTLNQVGQAVFYADDIAPADTSAAGTAK